MTSLTDPPKESFRLGMLIYDTRYRSLTIQVVALIGFKVKISALALPTIGIGMQTDTITFAVVIFKKWAQYV